MVLHNNGWLEVNVSMREKSVNSRTVKKIEEYHQNAKQLGFSEVRLKYLMETIRYLNNHGKTFLVRLPVSDEMFQIEEEFLTNFDSLIEPAIIISTEYLDMTKDNDKYTYTDGNHLYKESTELVSKEIADWVAKNKISDF